jgi:hypothetical protein
LLVSCLVPSIGKAVGSIDRHHPGGMPESKRLAFVGSYQHDLRYTGVRRSPKASGKGKVAILNIGAGDVRRARRIPTHSSNTPASRLCRWATQSRYGDLVSVARIFTAQPGPGSLVGADSPVIN